MWLEYEVMPVLRKSRRRSLNRNPALRKKSPAQDGQRGLAARQSSEELRLFCHGLLLQRAQCECEPT